MSESEIEEEMEKEELQERVQAKEEYIGGGDIHTDLEEIVPAGEKHRRSKKAKKKSVKNLQKLKKKTGTLQMFPTNLKSR
jgi:hypothetical protein